LGILVQQNGSFISVLFYGEKLPSWVEKFNEEKHYSHILIKVGFIET
jgi:predicted membrane channel-forming protein YqfA (hemolysin III family)